MRAAAATGRSAHPADWCVSRNVFVADSTEEARRLARSNSLGRCIEYILELTPRGPTILRDDGDHCEGISAGLRRARFFVQPT